MRRAGRYALALAREQLDTARFERLLADEPSPTTPPALPPASPRRSPSGGPALSTQPMSPSRTPRSPASGSFASGPRRRLEAELALGRGPALLGEPEALLLTETPTTRSGVHDSAETLLCDVWIRARRFPRLAAAVRQKFASTAQARRTRRAWPTRPPARKATRPHGARKGHVRPRPLPHR